MSFRHHLYIADRVLTIDDARTGQVGRSLGPLIFCSLYWWAGRDVAYAIGGAGMLGVCALAFGALKAPLGTEMEATKNAKAH